MDPQQPPPPRDEPEGAPSPQGNWNQAPPQQQQGNWQQSPQQPGWAPPPQQQQGWGQSGYSAPPPRPTGVTLASIFLIIMGVLWALGGAACSIGGGAIGGMDFQQFEGLGGAIGGALLVAGIIGIVIGIAQILAGAGALSGKGWARVTGIIVAAVAAVLLILGGLSGLGEDAASGVVTLVIGVLYALAAWAFIQAGPYFAYRR